MTRLSLQLVDIVIGLAFGFGFFWLIFLATPIDNQLQKVLPGIKGRVLLGIISIFIGLAGYGVLLLVTS